MERFIAILLEHTAGNFPLVNAEQAIILSLSRNMKYMQKFRFARKSRNSRQIDNQKRTIGKKIRDAETKKTRLC
jgi:threonyl-tRNA synthetase